jgi:hypothetical protein
MGRTPIETAPSPEREDVEYSTVCILQLIVAMLAAVLGRLSWKGGQDVSDTHGVRHLTAFLWVLEPSDSLYNHM